VARGGVMKELMGTEHALWTYVITESNNLAQVPV
jgi:hypothetical protein